MSCLISVHMERDEGQARFRSGRRAAAAVAGFVCLAFAASVAGGQALSPHSRNVAVKGDLFVKTQAARHSQSGWSSVIVKVDGELTPERESKLKALGADIYRRLPIVASFAMRIPCRNLAKLADLAFVVRI